MLKIFYFLIMLCICSTQFATCDEKFVPTEFLKATRPLRDTCLKKTGCTDEAIAKFISSVGPGKKDDKLKAYMSCVLVELQLIDANGNVIFDKLFPMFPDNIRDYIMVMSKNCMNLQGNNSADKVWWLHQCWKKADPQHYFMV